MASEVALEMGIEMPNDDRLGQITVLLRRWKSGDAGVVDELLPIVYDELRSLARAFMVRERSDHTLSSTALVHEAYLRLSRATSLDLKDRKHFFTVAARMMRRILVDHARSQFAEKRVGAHLKQPIPEAEGIDTFDMGASNPELVLAIDDLLEQLKELNPRAGQLVELRFFGGLSEVEAAEVHGVSRSTLSRDWRFARLWLYRQLSDR
jgi:RNA polymerase sigma factor (TIGR02999 family)